MMKKIRETLLGYRFEFIARTTSIAAERLRAIEEDEAAPTVFELDALARVYGIDADILAEAPVKLSPGDGVELLTSQDEFKSVDDITRLRVVAAANAARDLISLRRREGASIDARDARGEFARERPQLMEWRKETVPYKQGAALARELRRYLGLGNDPVLSMRDVMEERFPSVAVLHADLGGYGPAGLSFVDALRGPTIVLNMGGKNTNSLVRRFSLAHELCHLLVDWNGSQPIANISGYFTGSAMEKEQRANSFATRFLCPPAVLQQFDLHSAAFRRKLAQYGLPYAAFRLYVRNETGEELPKIPPVELTALGTEPKWENAEEPVGVDNFPLPEAPPERRTLVARAAAHLYARGDLLRDEFADMLGVTPAADLERVLDFFALDQPSDNDGADDDHIAPVAR